MTNFDHIYFTKAFFERYLIDKYFRNKIITVTEIFWEFGE